jgi:hypothetical protein
MHNDPWRKASDYLQQASSHMALGDRDRAAREIDQAWEFLNDDIAGHRAPASKSAPSARIYIEDARAGLKKGDSLEVVLALLAALQQLEREMPAHADPCLSGG